MEKSQNAAFKTSGSSTTELSSESVGKLLFKFSLPAIVAQLINVLYNMVDRMFIGHIDQIGPDALTGIGIVMPVIMCISAFAALVSMGGAARASIMLGRGDKKEAEAILGNCTMALLLIAAVLSAIFLLFGEKILLAFGASEDTIFYAWSYMKIYSIGTVFVQLTLGLNAFITAQGFAKYSMITVTIGAVLNILLDPIFIYAFNLGVKGAALATILSQCASAFFVCRFLTSEKSTLKIKRPNLRIRRQIFLPCIALGASPFVMQFTESILYICFNTSLLKYGGDLAVGVMTIVSSAMQFSMLPIQGLTQGAQPIISFNYGAKDMQRVTQAFKLLLISCLTYAVLIWAVAMLAPQLFAAIFTSDAELAQASRLAMRIYMAAGLLMGAQLACQQTFIALGNAKISLFLALLRKVFLLIPLIFILPHFFEDKVAAVFLAEPISDTIAVTTTVILFSISFHRLKKQVEGNYENTQ